MKIVVQWAATSHIIFYSVMAKHNTNSCTDDAAVSLKNGWSKKDKLLTNLKLRFIFSSRVWVFSSE